MALKNISTSKVKIYNPYGLYVTPFTSETAKGSVTYFLDEVIRDTTTITQEDPTENKIENEFGSAPILNNVTLGSYTFSAEVADMQPELLEKLCGYRKGTNGRAIAPSTYVPVYAEIVLVFQAGAGTYYAAVLPKVQLNSKATFDSLSSNMGRLTLAGTGLNLAVSDGSTTVESPFYLDTNYTRPNEIGLAASSVTTTGFTVTASPYEGEAAPTTYEWKVNGTVQSDTDNELAYTSASAKTAYTVECRGKRTDSTYTDWATLVVTTA
jgi:hypothetical protein